jgi:putative ABC transport system permease protein
MYRCAYGSAEYMKNNFGQVEDFCRINNAGSPVKLKVNNDTYYDQPLCMGASENFFDFFSYELLTNNPKTALETKSCLVISEELARVYFGATDAVGQIITFTSRNKEEAMVVTGVFRKPVNNSQLKFDMIRLIGEKESRCYVRLSPGTNPNELESILKENKENIPIIHDGTPGQYYLEPFQKTYFNTSRYMSVEASRDKKDLWVAMVIGLLIMAIASFNFLGLINNNLYSKTKEFTVRRINGGSVMDLVKIFMSENLVLIAISFVFSLYLMVWITPYFNSLTDVDISIGFILQFEQVLILLSAVFLLVLITFLFAFFRIRLDLKRNALKPVNYKFGRRIQLPAFNIFQIASSVALIICAIVIIRQMNFISEKPIGLNKQVIEVRIPGQYQQLAPTFKDELEKVASIEAVSITTASPVLEHFLVLLQYNENGVDKQYSTAIFMGDENYFSTVGIQLVKGEGFSGNPSADKDKCLINESLAKQFPNQDLIGKELPGMESYTVLGIVKDFHYSSLKSAIEPGIITFSNKGGHLMVKASENQLQNAQDAIEKTWAKLIPDLPLNVESIGDRFEWFHRENKNYIRLIGACCIISIFLSMIGLFAISFQTSRFRTKEIGIRKVNGAKIWEVMLMLNMDFMKWVAIAFVIATPIAWYVMDKWLQNFAYRSELNWWIFVLSGLLTLAIALLTVSWQCWLAARRNPVEALRYE